MAASLSERYRLERKISSKGSFGEVWLATDTLLDRPVVVKCPKVAHDPAQRERFVAEARMLARLNHPNITQIHDALFDEGEDRFYLVMEYVDGQDLAEIIAGGTPLPLDIVLHIAKGVLRALSYAHGQGIVHRDVKPGNVMIADDVKVIDFGLANLKSILQRRTDFMAGTLAYIAPEQIEGQPTDGRADLYSLGVMLFEMISGGQLPFDYADEDEILNAHLHAAPPLISQFTPTIPPVLEQVIVCLLAKDPEDRYPSADAAMEVLDSIPIGPKRSNLPIQPTPFVGREAVLAEITDRLQDPSCRLLTLVGPGGSGKTRLALKAAEAQLDNYLHGVFFVSLAHLDSTEAIVPTVAEALDFTFYEGVEPRQQLLDYLRQKNLLLIMDNFEHLLDGTGLVTEILKTAPGANILATSRTRLNVGGEHRFRITGMDFPKLAPSAPTDAALRQARDAVQYSAVKLFLQGARRAQPGFELTDENLRGVIDVCRVVEGMPLAIRLAAAWVEMLSPREIATEIGQGLDFLETDLRDVPERQRSMRAVFDHSWKLLTEREVFQGLSVFRGGFTWGAAQRVTGASLRGLMALVDKSLLHRTPMGRYEVHELLRQYAAEKLDGSPAISEAVRDRHCAYYAAALQEWDADSKGARQQAALAEIEADSENARAAWNWAVEHGQVERLDQAINGLCRFYDWRGRYQEGEAVFRLATEKLAATASGDGPVLSADRTSAVERLRVLARISTWQSVFGRALGHTELAGQLLEKSLALLERPELADREPVLSLSKDTRPEKASVLLQMGHTVLGSDREEARQLYEQSLALYQALGDRWGTANALDALGVVAWHLGAYGEAKQLLEESLAIRQALGDQRGVANSLMSLGLTALYQGQLEEGEHLAREGLAILQEIGDRAGIAEGILNLGGTFVLRGKFAEAHALRQEGVAIYNDLEPAAGLAWSSITLGFGQAHLGQYEQARARGQMGLTLAREIGYRRGIGLSLNLLGAVALAEEAYAEAHQLLQESVAVYREIGQRSGLGDALSDLGYAARGLDQLPQAKQHLCEALQTATQIGAFIPLLLALPAIALLLADQGNGERAVGLYALASRYGFVANSRWFEGCAGKHIAAVAATLPPDVVAAAQERGRARDLDATMAELLAELEG